jgi:hypothetical protein
VSDRECSYPSQVQDEKALKADLTSRERSFGPNHNKRSAGKGSFAHLLLTPSSPANSPAHPLLYNPYDASSDAAVNLDHMHLLIHVTQDSDIFSLGTSVESYHHSGLSLGLREANNAPYLLHALLAFSAQHLAHLQPEKATHYLHPAVSLQTRAISLFNSTWTNVDESNCVAVLLFSSVLGHHLLAETLRRRDPGDLDTFIEHYVQCTNMHRGIFVIAESAWPLLMESELEPILSMSHSFTSGEPVGDECQPLHDLVDTSLNLTKGEKVATRVAIDYLQIGFDASNTLRKSNHNRHQMIYSWTMLVPPEVTNMLARKQPEALILLAYYAVLLHRGKTLWQVGDTGAFIFELIASYLGPEWSLYLEYPRNHTLGGA